MEYVEENKIQTLQKEILNGGTITTWEELFKLDSTKVGDGEWMTNGNYFGQTIKEELPTEFMNQFAWVCRQTDQKKLKKMFNRMAKMFHNETLANWEEDLDFQRKHQDTLS